MKDFIVNDEESLKKLLANVRAAQERFATYTQEQVDKIFFEAAMAANKARIPLAKLAVEETGMGVVEDKVIKNHYASEYIYNAYKNTKTCGVLEHDEGYGITRIAEPIGVLAAVIPTTNPTSTAERAHHFAASPCEEVDDRSGKDRAGSRREGGRARRYHRLDRSAQCPALGHDHA